MSNSPDRAEAQEPSSTSSITFPATTDSREVTDLRRRDEWVRCVAEISILSPIHRVVGMRLGHYYNGKTGQLNPSYATLARASGTTERTAQKSVAALKSLGWIAPTRTTGGRHDATNDFVLLIPAQRVSGRTPVQVKSKRLTGVQLGSARVSSSCADGCPVGHPNKVRKESRIEGAALPPLSADDEPPGPAIATVAKTADDDRVDAALEIDVPEPKRETAMAARLDRNCSDEDQNRTAALEAASYRTGRAAQMANGATPEPEGSEMLTAEHTHSRAEMFSKLKRCYPPHLIIGDDENNFYAFEIALDHGISFYDLVFGAQTLEGEQVELNEFLVRHCWVEMPLQPAAHVLH